MLLRYHILDVVKGNKGKDTIVMWLGTQGIHGNIGAVCLHSCDSPSIRFKQHHIIFLARVNLSKNHPLTSLLIQVSNECQPTTTIEEGVDVSTIEMITGHPNIVVSRVSGNHDRISRGWTIQISQKVFLQRLHKQRYVYHSN